ncbi:MAG: trigger factor [Hespellia sp.]|nr:trigger factor [Hespellia sp.]
MKKKLLAVLVSAAAVVALAGCSNGEISNDYIKISQYKGIEVDQVDVAEVTDDDVESQVQSNLSASAITTDVTDRAVQSGDTATIDYTGTIDGVAFDGGSATDYPLTIGSGAFMPGFEDQIIGHNIGETFDVNVTFPEGYQNADLANKAAVFSVTIKSLSVSTTPELTDDWVAANSKDSKNVDQYKKEIKKQLETSNEESQKSSLKSESLAAVLDKTEVKKYPEGDVEDQEAAIKNQYTSMAEYYGLEFADFLQQYMGMTEDDFAAQVTEAAQTTVKQNLVCELIAKKQKLAPTDKEYKSEIKKYAEDYGYEDSDAIIKQVGEDQLKSLILQDKVSDWLADNCVQVKPEADNTTTDDTATDNTTDGTSDTTTDSGSGSSSDSAEQDSAQ